MTDQKTVLLVDDDSEFVQSTEQLLEAAGFEVHTAGTGADGIEKAKAIVPNLIVLDVMMATQTEGFSVNQDLLKIPELSGVPVVMLSGIHEKLDLPYRFQVEEGWPCVAFLEKPILPEELLENVRKFAR